MQKVMFETQTRERTEVSAWPTLNGLSTEGAKGGHMPFMRNRAPDKHDVPAFKLW